MVEARRAAKSLAAEAEEARAGQRAFNEENEALKEDLRYLLDKYVGKGKPLVVSSN